MKLEFCQKINVVGGFLNERSLVRATTLTTRWKRYKMSSTQLFIILIVHCART